MCTSRFNVNLLFRVNTFSKGQTKLGNFTKNFYRAIETLLNFVQIMASSSWYTVQVEQHVIPLLFTTMF